MPYFLIFLFLTACAAPKVGTKQEAIAEAPSQAAETSQPETSVTEPKILPYPSKAWEEISNIVEFVDDGTYHDDPEEPETIPISEYDIDLYLTNINPYRKEYKQFFEEQLKIYGRDDNGALIINGDSLVQLNSRLGYKLFGVQKVTEIQIIINGITNLYPL